MHKAPILLIGQLPELEKELREVIKCDIYTATFDDAPHKIRTEWFHLCIVHLTAHSDTGQLNEEILVFLHNHYIPTIVFTPEPMHTHGSVIRDILLPCNRQSSILHFSSQSEFQLQQPIEIIQEIWNRRLPLNPDLKIVPPPGKMRNSRRDLYQQILDDLSCTRQQKSELIDLFRILFNKYDRVKLIYNPDHSPADTVTLWCIPSTKNVSQGYPIMVKCGPQEYIYQIRNSFQKYLFQLTAIRETGFATTTNLAALAIPSPLGRSLKPTDLDGLTKLYRDNSADEICQVFHQFFTETWSSWSSQKNLPQELFDQSIRDYYTSCLNMPQIIQSATDMIEQINETPDNIKIALHDNTIQFLTFFDETSANCPNPFFYLTDRSNNLSSLLGKTTKNWRLLHNSLCDNYFQVDNDKNIWLDGYEYVDWSPAVADIVALELFIKFQCLDEYQVARYARIQFERTLLNLTKCDQEPTEEGSWWTDDLRKAFRIICFLRKQVVDRLGTEDLEEYYVNLLFGTMLRLIDSLENDEDDITFWQIHALYSAASICHILQLRGEKDMETFLETILSAISTGTVAGVTPVATQAIKDTYKGLKNLIVKRYNDNQKLISAVETLEKDPQNLQNREALTQELIESGIANDTIIVEAVRVVNLAKSEIDSKQQILVRRHRRKLKEIEALENQKDLTIDAGQKSILEERVEILQQEIANIRSELGELDAE